MKNHDYLFDLDEFKNVDKVFQVRLCRSEDGHELIVTEWTKGKGITDFLHGLDCPVLI